MDRKLLLLLFMTSIFTNVSGFAKSLYINFKDGSSYSIELSDNLEYSFSDDSMNISSPSSQLSYGIDNISTISYYPLPGAGITSPDAENENPLFYYTGSSITIKAGAGTNLFEIYNPEGRRLFSTTFTDSYTLDPTPYISGVAIITVNGKHSLKIRK